MVKCGFFAIVLGIMPLMVGCSSTVDDPDAKSVEAILEKNRESAKRPGIENPGESKLPANIPASAKAQMPGGG